MSAPLGISFSHNLDFNSLADISIKYIFSWVLCVNVKPIVRFILEVSMFFMFVELIRGKLVIKIFIHFCSIRLLSQIA